MKELNASELSAIEGGGDWGKLGGLAGLWNSIKQVGTDLGTAAGYAWDALYGPGTGGIAIPLESPRPD